MLGEGLQARRTRCGQGRLRCRCPPAEDTFASARGPGAQGRGSPPAIDTEGVARRRVERVEEKVDSGVAALVPDPDRPRAWTLLLNGVPQSHVDLDDPEYLDFEYVRRLGHVVDLVAPLRVLHLGGGALTLARYVAATRPRPVQQVIEVDAALAAMVRRRLPLASRVRIRTGDARKLLERLPEAAFDLVVGDAYADGRAPAHLTSAEFYAAVARTLRAGGHYAANVADGVPLSFARSQAATLRGVFGQVCLIADPGVLRGRRFGNLIMVAGRNDPPVAGLTRRTAGDPFPARVVHGEELTRFVAGAAPVTDASARPSPEPPRGLFRSAALAHNRISQGAAPT